MQLPAASVYESGPPTRYAWGCNLRQLRREVPATAKNHRRRRCGFDASEGNVQLLESAVPAGRRSARRRPVVASVALSRWQMFSFTSSSVSLSVWTLYIYLLVCTVFILEVAPWVSLSTCQTRTSMFSMRSEFSSYLLHRNSPSALQTATLILSGSCQKV